MEGLRRRGNPSDVGLTFTDLSFEAPVVRANADATFIFPQVPPGAFTLFTTSGAATDLQNPAKQLRIELRPSETQQVIFGGD
jgi:hypothetical protein